jgi:hypothetical protein
MITGILEVVQWALYDQQPVPVGTSIDRPVELFTGPWATEIREGRSVYTCPYLRTNLIEQPIGRHGQKFVIERLNALFLRDGVPLPISSPLYGRTLIRFSINQKAYWEGPAWLCASPFALFSFPAEELPKLKESFGIEWRKVGASFVSGSDRGWIGPGESIAPLNGILIETADQFSVEASIENNTDPDVILAIYLDGPLARPVM